MFNLNENFTFDTNFYIMILLTKKEKKMIIFKEKDCNEISNNYYNTYKADLEKREVKKRLFSLTNIIKVEFFTLAIGLIFMGYNSFFNHFSIELQDNFFTSHELLPKNDNFNEEEVDSTLISQLRNAEVDTVEIKEESPEEKNIDKQMEILSEKLKIDSTDMTLLVEILKSQMSTEPISEEEDKIIISQL